MLPLRRADEAEHELHQRGLAGAVVSDEGDRLAFRQVERDVAHGLDLAEALRRTFSISTVPVMAGLLGDASGGPAAT